VIPNSFQHTEDPIRRSSLSDNLSQTQADGKGTRNTSPHPAQMPSHRTPLPDPTLSGDRSASSMVALRTTNDSDFQALGAKACTQLNVFEAVHKPGVESFPTPQEHGRPAEGLHITGGGSQPNPPKTTHIYPIYGATRLEHHRSKRPIALGPSLTEQIQCTRSQCRIIVEKQDPKNPFGLPVSQPQIGRHSESLLTLGAQYRHSFYDQATLG